MKVDVNDLVRFLTIRQALSKNSIRHTLSRWEIFSSYLGGKTPTKYLVEDFLFELKEIGRKNNTINTYVFALRMVDKYFQYREIIVGGFTNDLNSLPKNKTAVDVLTYNDLKMLLSVNLKYGKFRGLDCDRLNELYKTMIRFLASTGCRYGEMQDLKVKYFDEINGRVTFIETKNKEWRNQYIREPLLTDLKELVKDKNPDDLIFTTMMGNSVPPTNFSEDLRKRARVAGIKKRVHPHLFRHSYATDLYWNGIGMGEIQQLLGHKDIKTTIGYIHNYEDRLITAAESFSLYLENMDLEKSLRFIYKKFNQVNLSRFLNLNVEKTITNNELCFRIRGSPNTLSGPVAAKL